FDKKTGDIKREQKRPNASFNHSTPVLVEVNRKPQLLVSASGALEGLDPADGKAIWWAEAKGDVPTPVYANGLVYCEGGRGRPGVRGRLGRPDLHQGWAQPLLHRGEIISQKDRRAAARLGKA